MNTLQHNQRVLHVLERVTGVISSEMMSEAINWMMCYCPPLKSKPIEMIDDDAKYQQLLAAIESLESGEPRS